MGHSIWNTPSGRERRWVRRRTVSRVPEYARYTVLLLALALIGTLVWEGVQYVLHPAKNSPAVEAAPSAPSNSSAAAAIAWQRDVAASLEAATAAAGAGNITQAEMNVDRAASIVTAARLQTRAAAPDVFESALSQLNRVLIAHPGNERLFEHVTLARIELAQLRSCLEGAVLVAPPFRGASSGSNGADSNTNHVTVGAPRTIAAGHTLDPASLGGNYLDATLMPEGAEILLPPATRLFVDNARVENLTLAGASQTLDGIHWKTVTFIGTRLRYEGGAVDLRNVRFVHCTFGFSTDDRGARLANAIALGQTSLVIE